MRPLHAGNISGYWTLKQGSLNTALVEATATLLLWQMEGTEEVTIKMVNDCGFVIMAIRSGENSYRLFAFQLIKQTRYCQKNIDFLIIMVLLTRNLRKLPEQAA